MTFDGETLVSDPAAHSTRTRSASRNLARGFYPVSIAFYKNTGSESLVLEWEGPGLEREVVPASAFCHLPVAEILPTGYAQGLVFADSETSGALRAPLTGTYRLTASSAKGFRLWLDGTLLVEPLLMADKELLAALRAEQNVIGISAAGTYVLLLHEDGSLTAPHASFDISPLTAPQS